MPTLRKDNMASAIAGVITLATALAIYLPTMAQKLTAAHGGTDGAELAVAVQTLGIPHPTGYPTYVLLAQFFRLLPGGSLAARLSLFSAVAAALAAAIVAMTAAELFSRRKGGWTALLAGGTSGLTLVLAGLFWSQAIIVEVYALQTLLLALSCWLLLRWRARGGLYLPLAGLTLGLGLGNHVSLLFLGPGIILFLLFAGKRPTWREGGAALGLFLAGLAVYLFLPLRAAADPWLNWGDPRGGSSFWAHVSGAAYRDLLFRVPWDQALGRLSAVVGLLWRDMAPWGIVLGLGGLLLLESWDDRPALFLLACPAGLGLLLALTYGGAGSEVHLLPLYLLWSVGAGLAAGWVGGMLADRPHSWLAWVSLLLPALILGWGAAHASTWNLRGDLGVVQPLTTGIQPLPAGALVLTQTDEYTFPLWYIQVVDGTRPDLAIVDVRLLAWSWYRRQLPTRYPGLAVPAGDGQQDWLAALLQENPGKDVFVLAPLPLPEGYGLRYEGGVFAVVRR